LTCIFTKTSDEDDDDEDDDDDDDDDACPNARARVAFDRSSSSARGSLRSTSARQVMDFKNRPLATSVPTFVFATNDGKSLDNTSVIVPRKGTECWFPIARLCGRARVRFARRDAKRRGAKRHSATFDAMSVITLRDNRAMPAIAFGTYRLAGDAARDAVRDALRVGFRGVDTASAYKNERAVREAIEQSPIRDDVFVTSKISPREMVNERVTRAAIEGVVERLGRAPDLLLIHWPGASDEPPTSARHRELRAMTWRCMEDAQSTGRLRSIGVSNFEPRHLEELMSSARVTPSVNQVELHPRFTQRALREYCASHGIHVQAYSPLGVGTLLEDEKVVAFARSIGMAPAPALVRWALSRSCSVVVKSSRASRAEENFSASRVSTAHATEQEIQIACDALERAFESAQRKECWDPSVVR